MSVAIMWSIPACVKKDLVTPASCTHSPHRIDGLVEPEKAAVGSSLTARAPSTGFHRIHDCRLVQPLPVGCVIGEGAKTAG